jgi:L-threonylcarbamoyladenylate synthase
LIVHVADLAELPEVTADATAGLSDIVACLAAAFWPGPLTLVLPRGPRVAPNVSAGRDTVAVRIPSHPVALALLRASGLPIAAPSANLFSRPSPTTAQHVLEDLAGRVDLILDGGPTTIGLESTVVDLTVDPPRLLRPGGVPVETLRVLVPTLHVPARPVVRPLEEATAAPGMLLKHYAPRARMALVRGDMASARRIVENVAALLAPHGLRVGVLAADEEAPAFAGLPVEVATLGSARELDAVARALFARLRELDGRGVDLILARELPAAGLGLAIGDRLYRAAQGHVLGPGEELDAEWLLAVVGLGNSAS